MRRARGAREPRAARRPQDHDRLRGPAGQHADAQARPAVHPRRRPGPGGVAPRALRVAAGRSCARTATSCSSTSAAPAGRRRSTAPRSCPTSAPEAAIELDPVPKAAACAQELAARGVDAAQYTTAAWVADLDAVRAALGYGRVNLWGGVLRHAGRARIPAPPPAARAQRGARRRRAAVHEGDPRRLADARGRARGGARGLRGGVVVQRRAPRSRRDAGQRSARQLGPAGRDGHARRSAHRRAARRSRSPSITCWRALQPLVYLPELAALIPEIARPRGRGRLRSAVRRRAARRRRRRRADERRAPLFGDLRRGRAARRPRRPRGGLAATRDARAAPSACSPCATCGRAARQPADAAHAGGERRAGADPLGRARPGDAARQRRRSRRRRCRTAGTSSPAATATSSRRTPARRGCRARSSTDPAFATLPASCVEHFEQSVRAAAVAGPPGARAVIVVDERRQGASAGAAR